jgi:hypothetical protein
MGANEEAALRVANRGRGTIRCGHPVDEILRSEVADAPERARGRMQPSELLDAAGRRPLRMTRREVKGKNQATPTLSAAPHIHQVPANTCEDRKTHIDDAGPRPIAR